MKHFIFSFLLLLLLIIYPCNTTIRVNNVPKLVVASGHTKEECESKLESFIENYEDIKSASLVYELFGNEITDHSYRGYSVLRGNITEIHDSPISNTKRPIWFIFTGMGSQWPGMGRELMKIKVFEESIRRSAEVLKPEGYDLLDLIFNSTDETFDNVINSFTMIVATQVALVDLFKAIGIEPDGLIGVSAGELVCAYADGGLTLEQTILSSYWRGKCILDSDLIVGAMANVAMEFEDLMQILPSDIEVAGKYPFTLVLISGPKQSIEDFVALLTAKGIFCQVDDKANIPFHSSYLTKAGDILKKEMAKFIPNPKERSPKWLSTAVAEEEWETPIAKLCSPDYFVHNFLQPINFLEVLKHIPENAIIVHPYLDNRELNLGIVFEVVMPDTTSNIGVHEYTNQNHISELLSGMGKLYIAGTNPDYDKLSLSENISNKQGSMVQQWTAIGWVIFMLYLSS